MGIQIGPNERHRVAVDSDSYVGIQIQYEIYIPAAIWGHPAVVAFRQRIDAIESGGTIFGGLTGIWQGAPEGTQIYRKIIRADHPARSGIRASLQHEAAQLLAELSADLASAQESIMLTETEVGVTLVQNPRRLP